MAHLLHLDASADPQTSTSRQLTGIFAREWLAADPANTVTYRDLHRNPPPYITTSGMHWPAELRAPHEQPDDESLRIQAELIDELTAADVLLIGAPMYTWSVPATLKSWLEHIHVISVTTPPLGSTVGPVTGRPAVVISSRGATYPPGTPAEFDDHLVPALRVVLEKSMGMPLHAVTAELTLAGRLAPLADKVGERDASYAAAEQQAIELARRLGSPTA